MLSANNIKIPMIPVYQLSDDELRHNYEQYQDEDPYFYDYDGSGNEYIPEKDDESLKSEYGEINNNIDYYDIFFKLPKKERIKLISIDIEKDYKQRMNEIKMEKFKYEINIKYFKKKKYKKIKGKTI